MKVIKFLATLMNYIDIPLYGYECGISSNLKFVQCSPTSEPGNEYQQNSSNETADNQSSVSPSEERSSIKRN